MMLPSLVVISKSRVTFGEFKPLMWRGPFGSQPLHVNETVRDALRVRLKGAPVYHGGSKQRVKRLAAGKQVSHRSTGYGNQGFQGVHTSTNRTQAVDYANAGRSRSSSGFSDGAVATIDAKGLWPKQVVARNGIGGASAARQGTEIAFDASQLRGRVRVDGARRARSDKVRSRMELERTFDEKVARARRLRDSNPDVSSLSEADDRLLRLADEPTSAERARMNRKRFFSGELG